MSYLDLLDLVKQAQWERNVTAARVVWNLVEKVGVMAAIWPHADKWMREQYGKETRNGDEEWGSSGDEKREN